MSHTTYASALSSTVGTLKCEDGFHANLIDNIFQKSFENDGTKHHDHIHNIVHNKLRIKVLDT